MGRHYCDRATPQPDSGRFPLGTQAKRPFAAARGFFTTRLCRYVPCCCPDAFSKAEEAGAESGRAKQARSGKNKVAAHRGMSNPMHRGVAARAADRLRAPPTGSGSRSSLRTQCGKIGRPAPFPFTQGQTVLSCLSEERAPCKPGALVSSPMRPLTRLELHSKARHSCPARRPSRQARRPAAPRRLIERSRQQDGDADFCAM
jgi:hypothetical protein